MTKALPKTPVVRLFKQLLDAFEAAMALASSARATPMADRANAAAENARTDFIVYGMALEERLAAAPRPRKRAAPKPTVES